MVVNSKKILVIGNGNSIFVKDFIQRYTERGICVDLLSLAPCDPMPTVRFLPCCQIKKNHFCGKIGKFINITVKIRDALAGLDKSYDAVVVHYVNVILFPHVLKLKTKTKNLVSVVYGSDFYRASELQDKLQAIIYFMSDRIVFTNPTTREALCKKHRCIKAGKLHVARFGLPVLDAIDKIENNGTTRTELNSFFGFPMGKVIISVGYSASSAHRHEVVIRSISRLPEEMKKIIHLVFPLGYGEANVEHAILQELKGTTLSYSILNEFYDSDDTAKLRCATDILINVQASDQFSGTMQETLYAGGNVIAGDWLPYRELISKHCRIYNISAPEDVGKAVEQRIISHKAFASPPGDGVRALIQKLSSWKSNLPIWDDILFKRHFFGNTER